MVKSVLFLMVFAFGCSNIFAASPTPTPFLDAQFDAAAKALEKAKAEAQSLRDSWDKAKLEATLYDKRAKRAYQKWTAQGARAAKSLRKDAEAQKDRAETEFKLSIEKRKLAWNEWQVAQFRAAAQESKVKSLEQERDIRTVKERIRKLEEGLKEPGNGKTPTIK